MLTIDITSLSGHSPYNISICDISYSNCSVVATGVVSAPVTVTVPTLLESASELIISVTDSIGCEYFEVITCITPSQTPTITPTPTVTPTNISCNCITFVNNTAIEYGYGYTDCDGFSYTYKLNPYTTVYVCGKDPNVFGSPITYSMGLPCVDNSCPIPSQTPTTTPTVTPTLPPITGYFQDCCDPSYQFIISDIPTSYLPLSGIYFVDVDKFRGCAISVSSFSSPNVFSFISMSTSFASCDDCVKANPFYVCTTPTPTPTITTTPTNTPTVTPTVTPTTTTTPTVTPTVTPTNVVVDCSTYILTGGTDILKYDVITNALTPLTFPSPIFASDNANSYGKFWLTSGSPPFSIVEYNIIPTPFSAVYSKH